LTDASDVLSSLDQHVASVVIDVITEKRGEMMPTTMFRFSDPLDGEEIAVVGRRVVCPTCDGTGRTDPPEFSGGFTTEDFDEDPDFEESYRAGVYDVACPECHGENVIIEPDPDQMSTPARLAYERYLEETYELEHEQNLRDRGYQF
jgi:hypothetical protein